MSSYGTQPSGSHGRDEKPKVGANPESVKAGHEPDQIDVKGILIVPAIIVVGMVIAYVTVSILIGMFRSGLKDPAYAAAGNKMALERANKDLPDRLATINNPQSKQGYDQPRLEGLKSYKPDEVPVSMRSRTSLNKDNYPEYHPEDLRPDRIPWLSDKDKAYGWVEEGKLAHVPIERAIKMILEGKTLQTQPKPLDPAAVDAPWERGGRLSNAGQGIATKPAAKHDEHKKDEHKEEPKKDEPKKEGEKK